MTQAPVQTAKKNTVTKGEQLTGQQLIDKVASFKGRPIDEIAKECGYYKEITNNETGETRVVVLTSELMAATLKAQSGIEFAPPARVYSRRSGRPPVVTVGGNGNIVVGIRYSSVAGFEPGTKVQIEAAEGRILVTAQAPSDESDADDGSEQDDLDL